MKRRSAVKHLGVVSSGLILLPYAYAEREVPLFSNLQSVKNNEKLLIGSLSNYILPEDPVNFSTPEPRSQFVLTMINDCSNEIEIEEASNESEKKIRSKNNFGDQKYKFYTKEFDEVIVAEDLELSLIHI